MTVHTIQHKMLGFVKSSKSFLIDEDDIVLIDAGPFKGSARAILETLETMGKEPGSIDLCILTHRHRDHTGGLKALKDMCGFEVASHSEEAEPIEKATGVRVDHRLEDGDVVPRCGGIRVIHIPGHTEVNTCLLMGDKLFTGDTVFGRKGGLNPSPSYFNSDPDRAKREIFKLESFEFDAVYLSHGDDIPTGGREKLAELLRNL